MVACHQHPPPSPQIFYAFDELLLLKRGGETIFNGQLGERAQHLVRYFEAVEGVGLREYRVRQCAQTLIIDHRRTALHGL